MKWGYLAVAAALTVWLGLPFAEYNTETLLPLHTVQVARSSSGVKIVCDVGEGEGETWKAAVEDLKKRASGEVFFDTAEQLVCCDESLLEEIVESKILRPAAQVYLAKELQEPDGLSEYLNAHKSGCTVADIRAGGQA